MRLVPFIPVVGLASYVWGEFTSFPNFYLAYKKARKGKGNRPEVADFSFRLEENLFQLIEQVKSLAWQPGSYRHFTIYDRKPREISAAPFPDRVVHHALMNMIEPKLDTLFSPYCYACRKGKGVHAAVNQYQQWAKQYTYVLKLDVKRYFPTVDHNVLKAILARVIDEPQIMLLLKRIINGYSNTPSKGMAIGNLTSQFFANVYLNDLDHWVGNKLGIPAYLRYVDDMVLLANDKRRLWWAADQISRVLAKHYKMILHPEKIQIRRCSEKVDMFGYQVSRTRRWLRNDNGYRFRRRFCRMADLFARSEMEFADITPRVNSWLGHAKHGETLELCESIFDDVRFVRA